MKYRERYDMAVRYGRSRSQLGELRRRGGVAGGIGEKDVRITRVKSVS